ncbi:MAG TPA: PRTRC system protein B [Nevskia sp.]|nr:PRTRC system protein B [Nevskia sp.]
MLETYLSLAPAQSHSTAAQPTGATAQVEEAIVLSRMPGSTTLLTHHAVEADKEGRHRLGAGTPVSHAHVIGLLLRLAKGGAAFLPENVVCASPAVLAWWVPSRRAPQFWRLGNRTYRLQVPWPALYFVAGGGRSLRVFALDGDARPTPGTPLYHAPLGNIYQDGGLCWGNIEVPELAVSSIPAYEEAIYGTNYTHTNFPKNFRSAKGKGENELFPFWKKLQGRKSGFPIRELVPARLTAAAALGGE